MQVQMLVTKAILAVRLRVALAAAGQAAVVVVAAK